jgi:hypothetical protein
MALKKKVYLFKNMAYCEDCGTRMNGQRCPNCHEELEIMDQYYEQGMKLPSAEFQEKANAQAEAIKKRERERQCLYPIGNIESG